MEKSCDQNYEPTLGYISSLDSDSNGSIITSQSNVDPETESRLCAYLDRMAARRGFIGSIRARPKWERSLIPLELQRGPNSSVDEESKILGSTLEDFFNTEPNTPNTQDEIEAKWKREQSRRDSWLDVWKSGKVYQGPQTPKTASKKEREPIPANSIWDDLRTLIGPAADSPPPTKRTINATSGHTNTISLRFGAGFGDKINVSSNLEVTIPEPTPISVNALGNDHDGVLVDFSSFNKEGAMKKFATPFKVFADTEETFGTNASASLRDGQANSADEVLKGAITSPLTSSESQKLGELSTPTDTLLSASSQQENYDWFDASIFESPEKRQDTPKKLLTATPSVFEPKSNLANVNSSSSSSSIVRPPRHEEMFKAMATNQCNGRRLEKRSKATPLTSLDPSCNLEDRNMICSPDPVTRPLINDDVVILTTHMSSRADGSFVEVEPKSSPELKQEVQHEEHTNKLDLSTKPLHTVGIPSAVSDEGLTWIEPFKVHKHIVILNAPPTSPKLDFYLAAGWFDIDTIRRVITPRGQPKILDIQRSPDRVYTATFESIECRNIVLNNVKGEAHALPRQRYKFWRPSRENPEIIGLLISNVTIDEMALTNFTGRERSNITQVTQWNSSQKIVHFRSTYSRDLTYCCLPIHFKTKSPNRRQIHISIIPSTFLNASQHQEAKDGLQPYYPSNTIPTTCQFRNFRNLPQKIRSQIWEHARPPPRIIKLSHSSTTKTIYSTAPIPILLHTTQGSRSVALKWYTLSFGTPTPKTYFDFSRDGIYTRCRGCIGSNCLHKEHLTRDHESVKLLAYEAPMTYIPFRKIARFYPSVEHLILIKGKSSIPRGLISLEDFSDVNWLEDHGDLVGYFKEMLRVCEPELVEACRITRMETKTLEGVVDDSKASLKGKGIWTCCR